MKNILAPESLIRYQPAIQIYDSMKAYHQQKYKNEANVHGNPKCQQIIDSIIPPRDWTDHNSKLHIQYVSHQPATRDDVNELTATLDQMLSDRQAKKNGICAIRQQLYSQAFDQLIRQVAVDCPERGLLLMRVRDQHKMTLAAYETIYQSSIVYGLRKQVESEQGIDSIEEEYNQYNRLKQQLEVKKNLLLGKKDLLEKQMKENRLIQIEKRDEQLKFLKVQKENMSKFLQSVRAELRSCF